MTKDDKAKIVDALNALWLIVASDRKGMSGTLRNSFDEDQWCKLVEAVIVLNDKFPEVTDG